MTDKPNTEVSWQVTARRNDKYIQDNPFIEVKSKVDDEDYLINERTKGLIK